MIPFESRALHPEAGAELPDIDDSVADAEVAAAEQVLEHEVVVPVIPGAQDQENFLFDQDESPAVFAEGEPRYGVVLWSLQSLRHKKVPQGHTK